MSRHTSHDADADTTPATPAVAATDPAPTRSYPRVIDADGLQVTVQNEGEEAHYLAAKGRREKAEAEAAKVEAATPPPAPEEDGA